MNTRTSFINPIHLATAVSKDGGAPDWIQIFPAGVDLKTTDGRAFKMSDVSALAKSLNDAGTPILIDYDHKSHYTADDGGNTEAAGWLTKFDVREGALWALAEWTEKAARQITQKLFRYVSPEFLTTKKEREVTGLKAVALLNRPAFEMTALASQQNPKEPNMEKIALALGLDKDADETAILAAITKADDEHKTELATAQAKAKTPSTDDFMPRADYAAVLARAETAEKKAGDQDKVAFDGKVETMIAAAITAGKITPASKDHYVALCTDEKTFENTRKALEVSPEVIGKTEITGKVDKSDANDPNQIANLARAHQREQREAGIEVSTADAVHAVTKGAK